ncbi:MAG: NAD(P)/FAD-dependent oxidoreductase [Solirubrobacteraceae bacterium]
MSTKQPTSGQAQTRVVIVGGGFAGLGCARELAGEESVHVTLIDQHNYHQFQPLLYQVATSQLPANDIASSLRKCFRTDDNIDVKLAEVTDVDPANHSVTTAEGDTYAGDVLVLAAGARANFFNTPGAAEHSFPLYSLADAERLRTRILTVFEDADREPALIARGALNFVIVGAGATGTELAGSMGDMIKETMPVEYHDLAVENAAIYVVDLGQVVLNGFSDSAHDYASKALQERGVQLKLGTSVKEVAADHVVLSDGTKIDTRCVAWAGGLMAGTPAHASGIPQGRGGRIDVEPDLTVQGYPGVYVVGDIANIPGPDGIAYPQLGSVAQQSGQCVAKSILAEVGGDERKTFHYHDKGIMAMIGRGAAVAEVGKHRHELHGSIAFAAWLGVHAALMTGVRQRIDAFINWGWDYFSNTRGPSVLDQRSDAAHIDWGDAEDADVAESLAPRVAQS